jgi:hypothetical protein
MKSRNGAANSLTGNVEVSETDRYLSQKVPMDIRVWDAAFVHSCLHSHGVFMLGLTFYFRAANLGAQEH